LSAHEASDQAADEQEEDEGGRNLQDRASQRGADCGRRGHRHGRPIRRGGARQPDENRVAAFVDAVEQALESSPPCCAGKALSQRLQHALVRQKAPGRWRKKRLQVAVERTGVREVVNPELGHDLPEPQVRNDRRQEVRHGPAVGAHPEAEADEARAGSHEARRAARDRPSDLANARNGRRSKIRMPRQCRAEGPQGVEDLSLEVVQDQPRPFRNGCGRQLVVKGLQVPRPKRRRGRKALQEVVHRRDLLVERSRQGHGRSKRLLAKSPPFLAGAPEQQGRRDDAGKSRDGDESHGHHQAETGRVSGRDALGHYVAHRALLSGQKGNWIANAMLGRQRWTARLKVDGGRSGTHCTADDSRRCPGLELLAA
jgi:hypothetical protein